MDKFFVVNFDGNMYNEKEAGQRMTHFLNMISNLVDDETFVQLAQHIKQD